YVPDGKEKVGNGKIVFDLDSGRTVSVKMEFRYGIKQRRASGSFLTEAIGINIKEMKKPPKEKKK
ncbi:MAG: hypothetical protein ACYTAF_06475, partial [Planctomycetota bacterium]